MPDIVYKLNDPGMSAVWCVVPALDAAIATGIVDPAKVGLHGHSWGGYQTAFLVTQTNRFKARHRRRAADRPGEHVQPRLLEHRVGQPADLREQPGPVHRRGTGTSRRRTSATRRCIHAKKVKTPLLILHNDKDGAVDFTQGVEYFNTLRRLQKPVVMLQYKGENHGLAKPENRKDYAVRMREFFDHHLMGKPAPDWWRTACRT